MHNDATGKQLQGDGPAAQAADLADIGRRRLLASSVALALGTAGPVSFAQGTPPQARPAAPKPLPADALRIVIPANTGGGWDQTGRALGTALQATGAASQIVYDNMGGQGGTIGLAKFVEQHTADPRALLIGGIVMVGAVALQKPAIGLDRIQPLARLTSDYLVVAVASSSPIRTTQDLAAAMRADLSAVPIAGGSAGGVDHLFSGILARAVKARTETLAYQPYAGGAEVVDALLKGRAAVGISGYSEFAEAIAAGKIRAIGVSSRRGKFGLPSFREQGVDAEIANWRGVFTGRDVPAARAAEMVAAIERATAHESWQRALRQNRWDASWLTGHDLTDFIELDLATAQVIVYLLKLKA
jgi:putative tricarboxylic transport membrane protein